MPRLIAATLVSLLAACDSPASSASADAPADQATKAESSSNAKRSPRDAAVAFLSGTASEAVAAIDWAHFVQTTALLTLGMPEAAAMQASMIKTLADIDTKQAVAEVRKGLEASWTPYSGCTVAAVPTPPLPTATLSELPPEYAKTAAMLGSATFFTATCGEQTLRVGLDGTGSVVNFADMTPVAPSDAENRFIEYLTEPDEKAPSD